MSPPAVVAVRERLRIAIQKSGRLGAPSRTLLAACGLAWHEERDRLFCLGEDQPIDLLLVRDDDIPGLIADGVCDLGIVGRNVLAEQAARRNAAALPEAFRELRVLGVGVCRLNLAVPVEWDWRGPMQLQGRRIATSHPYLVERWLRQHVVAARVVPLSGSVEIAPRLGQADVVCDLVSSGATLAANQLKSVCTLLESEAVLAGPAAPLEGVRAELTTLLLQRLDGAWRVKNSRLLMFRAEREQVPALVHLLFDTEPPTVMQVDGTDTLALQAVCHGTMSWQRLEDLRRAGARGLMMMSVERMLT